MEVKSFFEWASWPPTHNILYNSPACGWLGFVESHPKPPPQVASTPPPASSSPSGPVGAMVAGVPLAPLPLLLWL